MTYSDRNSILHSISILLLTVWLLLLTLLVSSLETKVYNLGHNDVKDTHLMALSNSGVLLAQEHDPCWGAMTPCSDGKYRGPDGKDQPPSCDNSGCRCNMACGDGSYQDEVCQVYCRKTACCCEKKKCQ